MSIAAIHLLKEIADAAGISGYLARTFGKDCSFPAKCLLIVHWNGHICVGSRLDNGEVPAGGQGP
jgi:hypothetical protein